MLPVLKERPVKWLIDNISRLNIAEDFSDEELSAIAFDVTNGYEIDTGSRTDWKDQTEKGLKIAKQEVEPRVESWMANTKDPLIAIAANQFAARAGGELIRGRDVVKAQISGADLDGRKELRAKRVSDFMSWLCLDGMSEWESNTDQLLNSVSITGCYYKKTFYDPTEKCFNSYAISPLKVVVHNDAKSLTKATRVTEELEFTKNDAIERIRASVWLDIEDKMTKDDIGLPEKFIEQHCWYDLDGDGYKEPYVILVHLDSHKICRIAARYKQKGIFEDKGKVQRIQARHYYTKFPFLPSPDATYHDMGWAHLLGPLVETKQAIMNQIHDAGTMSNMGGGFVAKGARIQGGKLKFSLNEWKPVEATGQQLRDAFFPNPAKEPSAVLFNLLNMLDQKGMKLASISDSMTGDMPQGNTPATTVLALLDQGLKVFTSILRRLYRASKEEYKKLYDLISENLTDEEYQKVLDDPQAFVAYDFNEDDCDVQPVADPTAASEAIRLAIANAIHQALPNNPMALRYYLKSIGVKQKDIDEMVPPVDPKNPPPNPQMIKLQADITEQHEKLNIENKRIANDTARVEIEQALTPHKMLLLEQQSLKLKADAEKSLADAESKQILTKIDVFDGQLRSMQQNFDQQLALLQHDFERMTNGGDTGTGSDGGGTGGMAQEPDDSQDSGLPSIETGRTGGGSSAGEPFDPAGGSDSGDLLPSSGGSGGARVYTDPRKVLAAETKTGGMM